MLISSLRSIAGQTGEGEYLRGGLIAFLACCDSDSLRILVCDSAHENTVFVKCHRVGDLSGDCCALYVSCAVDRKIVTTLQFWVAAESCVIAYIEQLAGYCTVSTDGNVALKISYDLT